MVKTLWIEFDKEINAETSKIELFIDFIVVTLVKSDDTFWKDNFGKQKEINNYTAKELVENIILLNQELKELRIKKQKEE